MKESSILILNEKYENIKMTTKRFLNFRDYYYLLAINTQLDYFAH